MFKIFISAGDISGEMHAAKLAGSLKTIGQNISISSCGGEKLRLISDEFIADISSMGAFGFLEPLKQIFYLKKVLSNIEENFKNYKPDRVVLVDFYGFNIHIAKLARARGIPVYYYISPQIWASRTGRIHKLAKYVTKMLLILPFEEELYKNAGIDAEFVGHPLLDTVPQPLSLDKRDKTIGFFPGSRKSVLLKHFDLFNDSARLLKERLGYEILFFGLKQQYAVFSKFPYRTIYDDIDFKERSRLAFAVSVSGTVSLETALLGIPMAVTYKLSMLNYLIARQIVKIPYITMANIIQSKELIPELIQDKAVPQLIAETAGKIISNKQKYIEIHNELLTVRKKLGQPGVSDRAAKIILGIQ